jgi:hypothetical protein
MRQLCHASSGRSKNPHHTLSEAARHQLSKDFAARVERRGDLCSRDASVKEHTPRA